MNWLILATLAILPLIANGQNGPFSRNYVRDRPQATYYTGDQFGDWRAYRYRHPCGYDLNDPSSWHKRVTNPACCYRYNKPARAKAKPSGHQWITKRSADNR